MAVTLTTPALIIRENNNIGEADRFVVALTEQLGVIRASARGAQKVKSRNAGATRLLCYSRLSLIKGRDKYIIEDAQPLHVFFGLNKDIARLALAQYFCELAGVLIPPDEPAQEALYLLYAALHHLETGDRPLPLIKAATEMTLLSLCGLSPALDGCAVCGGTDSVWLSPGEGHLRCDRCGRPGDGVPVPPGVLAALRHCLTAPAARRFAFSLGADSLAALEKVSETYLLCQLGRGFRTLDFYKACKE